MNTFEQIRFADYPSLQHTQKANWLSASSRQTTQTITRFMFGVIGFMHTAIAERLSGGLFVCGTVTATSLVWLLSPSYAFIAGRQFITVTTWLNVGLLVDQKNVYCTLARLDLCNACRVVNPQLSKCNQLAEWLNDQSVNQIVAIALT